MASMQPFRRLVKALGLALLAAWLPCSATEALGLTPTSPVPTDSVRVRFRSDVGPYFAQVVDLVVGTSGVKHEEADTFLYKVSDRGTVTDYAHLFKALPYVVAVQPEPAVPPAQDYLEGELLVKFKPEVTRAQIDAFNAKVGTTIKDMIPGIEVYQLKLGPGHTVAEMQGVYERSGLVVYAEPNHKVHVPELPMTSGSVIVRLQPGASLELLNLVMGTRVLGTVEPCVTRLSPPPRTPAPLAARLLTLCPSVVSAEAAP